MPAKVGGLLLALVAVLGIGALLYFGGTFVVRFSDPIWRRKYLPLILFLSVMARASQFVLRMMQRSGADNRAFGLGFFVWLGLMAACIWAWRRYLIAHPDGPPGVPTPGSNPSPPQAK
jgi:hypothetical protein